LTAAFSISALTVYFDPVQLINESIRVTKDGGIILLSSYSDKIWDARLDWFIKQSKAGLLGEIDFTRTKDGTIYCKDGFKATTYSIDDFNKIIEQMNLDAKVEEVDNSSIFCIIKVKHKK